MLKTSFRLLLVVIYLIAGIIHLRSPAGFIAITPKWVPFAPEVVAFTGLCEIAGAIGLATRRYRYAAAVALSLYAIFVFPANINHALNNIAIGGTQMSWAYHGPRLAFQPVIIWWTLWVGDVIYRPRGASSGA